MKFWVKWIHRGVNVAVWGMFALSMIYMLIKWNDIPDPAGVHFNLATREFDVYASKWFCLYPHIVNIIVLVVSNVAYGLVWKVKVGVKINATGEDKLRTAFNIVIDVLQLSIVSYFAHWAWCMTRQEGLSKIVMDVSSCGLSVGIVSIVVGLIVIRIMYSN